MADIRGTGPIRNVSTESMQERMRRLASGRRINTAGEDAAALGVAVALEAQERSQSMAGRNALDALGRLQVADGGLEAQQGAMERLRELAVQAGNGVLSTGDRQAIQEEANGLLAEIERVGQEASYNDQRVLASNSTVDIQVGVDGDPASRIQSTINQSTGSSLGLTSLDFSSGAAAAASLETIDGALSQVAANRSTVGASQNRLAVAAGNAQNARESLAASRSVIEDADFAAETSALASETIRQQAAIAVESQARQQRSAVLRLLG